MQVTAKKRSNAFRKTPGERIFDFINGFILVLLCIVTLYPMWYVIVASFTENSYLVAHPGTILWPVGFTVGSYELAFTHPLLVSGYLNILFVLVVSLPINILLTLFCGYFLASKKRSLGLYNSLWALILPGAMSVYNSIICRTAIEAVPDSLEESAHIDGANDLVICFRIILPLIMPTIAVLLLYYGVGHWNSWFPASIYLQDNNKLPIQNVLRAVLIANSNLLNSAAAENDQVNEFAEAIKYSAIVLTTVPVLCIYPFLQRYFVKGVMIGAVKG